MTKKGDNNKHNNNNNNNKRNKQTGIIIVTCWRKYSTDNTNTITIKRKKSEFRIILPYHNMLYIVSPSIIHLFEL